MAEKLGRWRHALWPVTVATLGVGVTAAATYEGPQPVAAAVQEQTRIDRTEEQVLQLSRQTGAIASHDCLPGGQDIDNPGCESPNVETASINGLLSQFMSPPNAASPATLDEYRQRAHAPPAEAAPPPPLPPPTPAPQEVALPPPPPPQPESAPPADVRVWHELAECESGGNWQTNTGNGYYGGLQFSLESWRAVGGEGYPHEHPPEVQIEMAERLKARQGWGAWPACARRLGLR